MLIGSQGNAWQIAANELSQTLSLPIKSYRIAGDGDLIAPEKKWHKIYEITPKGAVFVRPDGHVAWRSHSTVDDPKDTRWQY